MLQVNNLKKEAEISKAGKFINIKSETQQQVGGFEGLNLDQRRLSCDSNPIDNKEKRTLGGNLDCLISEFLNLRQQNIDYDQENNKLKEQLDTSNHTYVVMSALQTKEIAEVNNIDPQLIFDLTDHEIQAQSNQILKKAI